MLKLSLLLIGALLVLQEGVALKVLLAKDGQIDVAEEVVKAKEGDVFDLVCESDSPVEWLKVSGTGSSPDRPLTKPAIAELFYAPVLSFRRTNGNDAGHYICMDPKTTEKQDVSVEVLLFPEGQDKIDELYKIIKKIMDISTSEKASHEHLNQLLDIVHELKLRNENLTRETLELIRLIMKEIIHASETEGGLAEIMEEFEKFYTENAEEQGWPHHNETDNGEAHPEEPEIPHFEPEKKKQHENDTEDKEHGRPNHNETDNGEAHPEEPEIPHFEPEEGKQHEKDSEDREHGWPNHNERVHEAARPEKPEIGHLADRFGDMGPELEEPHKKAEEKYEMPRERGNAHPHEPEIGNLAGRFHELSAEPEGRKKFDEKHKSNWEPNNKGEEKPFEEGHEHGWPHHNERENEATHPIIKNLRSLTADPQKWPKFDEENIPNFKPNREEEGKPHDDGYEPNGIEVNEEEPGEISEESYDEESGQNDEASEEESEQNDEASEEEDEEQDSEQNDEASEDEETEENDEDESEQNDEASEEESEEDESEQNDEASDEEEIEENEGDESEQNDEASEEESEEEESKQNDEASEEEEIEENEEDESEQNDEASEEDSEQNDEASEEEDEEEDSEQNDEASEEEEIEENDEDESEQNDEASEEDSEEQESEQNDEEESEQNDEASEEEDEDEESEQNDEASEDEEIEENDEDESEQNDEASEEESEQNDEASEEDNAEEESEPNDEAGEEEEIEGSGEEPEDENEPSENKWPHYESPSEEHGEPHMAPREGSNPLLESVGKLDELGRKISHLKQIARDLPNGAPGLSNAIQDDIVKGLHEIRKISELLLKEMHEYSSD